MKQKRVWSFLGLLIIALVVSMPFYVAEVYAVSVSVTKNEGQKGLKGFIDAEGDVWKVEATVSGAKEEVSADKVKIKVGENEEEFQSCTESALGTACEYTSSLEEGVAEGAYPFSVLYNYLEVTGEEETASDSDRIVADGSGPRITFNKVWQEKEKVKLDFSVEDEPMAGVGLEKIEIVGVEEGVLQTIEFEESTKEYNFGEGEFGGVLQASLSGEGKKWSKIRAFDRLGHETVSRALSFEMDFTAPVIKDSLEFVSLGKFIGEKEVETDIKVNITERGELVKVAASSEEAELEGEEGECEENGEEEGLWTCVWKEVRVQPSESVSLTIIAEDGQGNLGEKTLSKTFVADSSPPVVTFFGTVRTYEGVSYISGNPQVRNRIVLQVEESGAGMGKEGIKANLAGVGRGSFEAPDGFDKESYESYWDVNYIGGSDEVLIGLSKFEDKAGNEGDRAEEEVKVDSTGPRVEKIELYGWGEGKEKNYFSSGDEVLVRMDIREESGLAVLVDLNDIVMDAENKYPDSEVKKIMPETERDYAGWQAFYVSEENDFCSRKEGKWQCELITDGIKSNYDRSAEIVVEVYDTAGNKAAKWEKEPVNVMGGEGKYKFELLELEVLAEPNFWEVGRVVSVGGKEDFIDMDTTELMSTRMAFKIELKAESDRVEAQMIELAGCAAEEGFEYEQREVLVNNIYLGGKTSPVVPVIILEFAPFDAWEYFRVGEEAVFEKGVLVYTCELNIYSQKGKKALSQAERQEVKIPVAFAFTALGSKDENLAEKIKEMKENGWFKAGEVIERINYYMQIIKWVADFINILVDINEIVDIFSDTVKTTAEGTEGTEFAWASPWLRKICFEAEISQVPSWSLVQTLQIPAGVLSCAPAGKSGIGALDWVSSYQRGVMAFYTSYTGIPASSLYDNFWLSWIGLCIPGIIYNLQKLQQISCRRILCYEKEVPAGYATVEGCEKMHEVMFCEFFTGPAWRLLPGVATYDAIWNILQAAISSPAGLIKLGIEAAGCAWLCASKGKGFEVSLCKGAMVLSKAGDIADTLYGAIKSRPDVTGNPFCGMLKEEGELEESGGREVTAEEEGEK